MTEREKARLNRMLSERVEPSDEEKQVQIKAVKKYLEEGYYVDFNWALKFCNKTQRLSAIIYCLRHDEGMKIVEWTPTHRWGSAYAIYEYAPEEVRTDWDFLRDMTPSEVRRLNFAEAMRWAGDNEKVRANALDGQMTVFDYMESANKMEEDWFINLSGKL